MIIALRLLPSQNMILYLDITAEKLKCNAPNSVIFSVSYRKY